jgi:hypothetical protein
MHWTYVFILQTSLALLYLVLFMVDGLSPILRLGRKVSLFKFTLISQSINSSYFESLTYYHTTTTAAATATATILLAYHYILLP